MQFYSVREKRVEWRAVGTEEDRWNGSKYAICVLECKSGEREINSGEQTGHVQSYVSLWTTRIFPLVVKLNTGRTTSPDSEQ